MGVGVGAGSKGVSEKRERNEQEGAGSEVGVRRIFQLGNVYMMIYVYTYIYCSTMYMRTKDGKVSTVTLSPRLVESPVNVSVLEGKDNKERSNKAVLHPDRMIFEKWKFRSI